MGRDAHCGRPGQTAGEQREKGGEGEGMHSWVQMLLGRAGGYICGFCCPADLRGNGGEKRASIKEEAVSQDPADVPAVFRWTAENRGRSAEPAWLPFVVIGLPALNLVCSCS